MSMDAMVRDMRNRFLVAAVLSVLILLWSPIGRRCSASRLQRRFGLRDDVFALILSLPGDLLVLDLLRRGIPGAAVPHTRHDGAGRGGDRRWIYSVGVTLTGGGEVFYEAATVLARSSCWATGSRCGPAAGRTGRSA